MPEPVYVERYVTFCRSGETWSAFVWDTFPDGLGKVFKVRLRVPDELLRPDAPEVQAEVTPA